MSKPQGNDDAFVKALEESDQLGEVMEQQGVSMPSMSKMSRDLTHFVSVAGIDNRSEQVEEEELEGLLEEKTPVLQQEEVFVTPERSSSHKPKVSISGQSEEIGDYAESFASQRETTQLREELESMSGEVKELKTLIAGILKERDALPTHLSTIREDINRQMTVMLERLNGALESDVIPTNIGAAATTLEQVKERSVDRLAAAEDYSKDKPREGSPITTKGAELKGKRRFRPVR